ncbi:phage portal protein [Anoxybacillus flavithermus]|uniref:phage portal protein n=1 Tax=Anoxybacillus flavithermus TaxID=33934 RepID=UPI001866D1E4|nr:phage portal protein [Anoxybacillus flavithermus]
MVTSEQIKEAIRKHRLELPRYQKLYRYYTGKNDILNRTLPDPLKPNNKIATSYCSLIVDTVVGYFASKPVSYLSRSGNQKYLDDLHEIFLLNDEEDTNAEIVKDFTIFGKCYEFVYIDPQGNIRFKQYSPMEMHVEKDSQDNILFGIRYWKEKQGDSDVMKVEAYDAEGFHYFTSHDGGETFILDRSIPHYFGEVPIVIYHNNDEEIGDFEKQIPLVDAIDKILSDSANELESFANAYLLIKGYQGTQPEDVQAMRHNGVLLLDQQGDAEWLIKNVNNQFQQNFFETIDDLIHIQTATPKLTTEEFSSNLSGIAIGFKLFGLESKCSVKERKMEKALRKRIRLITNILNLKGADYQYTDIQMQFTRNIPQNDMEVTQQIVQLANIVDLETRLSWHPRIQNPKQVIEKLKKEQDAMDLDSIGDNDE